MCPLLSVRFYSFYFFIRFSMNIFFADFIKSTGGLKWTRTTDLALIRRAL